jgi:adenine-specific DNA-methyltransferase
MDTFQQGKVSLADEENGVLHMRHGNSASRGEVPVLQPKERKKKTPEIAEDWFESEWVKKSLACSKRPPSHKKDRRLQAKFDGSFGGSLDGYEKTSDSIDTIGLLPICYLGNKKRMLLHIWNFLDDHHVGFDRAFDAFSGSCVLSFFSRLSGKEVVANDVMVYPSLLSKSLLDPSSECPSDEDLDKIMGPEINQSNNIHMAAKMWSGMYFTESECEFLDRYRSNVISLYGPVAARGLDATGTTSIIPLDGTKRPDLTEGMMKASFAMYLVLTLIHQLCFTGGRFFRRQIIANVNYRLDHIRNKGEEIHSKPRDFMWLKEIRKFLSVIGNEKRDVEIYSEDIVRLLANGRVNADIAFLDPPYGGLSSDYGALYKIFEEYIWGVESSRIPYLVGAANRFKKPKGYREQLEETLTLCERFPSWLVSYNQRSFSSLDEIVSVIKKFRHKVDVSKSEIKYRYRKGAGDENEFLILARK